MTLKLRRTQYSRLKKSTKLLKLEFKIFKEQTCVLIKPLKHFIKGERVVNFKVQHHQLNLFQRYGSKAKNKKSRQKSTSCIPMILKFISTTFQSNGNVVRESYVGIILQKHHFTKTTTHSLNTTAVGLQLHLMVDGLKDSSYKQEQTTQLAKR